MFVLNKKGIHDILLNEKNSKTDNIIHTGGLGALSWVRLPGFKS